MHFPLSRLLFKLVLAFPMVALPAVWAAPTLQALDEQAGNAQALRAQAEQLFSLANQTRAAKGLGPLQWDEALAAAALQHCKRMSVEGPIAHRYGGEADLTERAAQAGAHFNLIAENIAVGAYPARIHEAWMESPGHRANLLNPNIDSVGISVVGANGILFVVADYSKGVSALTPAQVEEVFAAMLRAKGLAIRKNPTEARAYCASNGHFAGKDQPNFLMRWQNSDVSQLPEELKKHMQSERFSEASVGSCPAQDVATGFTTYRVAVLLYDADSPTRLKSYY